MKRGRIDWSGLVTAADKAKQEFSVLCTSERNTRDGLLQEVVWMLDRHRDEVSLGSDTTLTSDQHMELLQYVQGLRNVPQQEGFPLDVKWPDKPTFLK